MASDCRIKWAVVNWGREIVSLSFYHRGQFICRITSEGVHTERTITVIRHEKIGINLKLNLLRYIQADRRWLSGFWISFLARTLDPIIGLLRFCLDCTESWYFNDSGQLHLCTYVIYLKETEDFLSSLLMYLQKNQQRDIKQRWKEFRPLKVISL